MDLKIVLFLVVIVAVAAVFLVNQEPPGPGRYDDFAKCLTDADLRIYGTETCTYCKAQKEDFGSSFQYVDFINCDIDSAACDALGVTGYPTWVGRETRLRGKQSLSRLSDVSGCPLE